MLKIEKAPADLRNMFYSGNMNEVKCIGHFRGDFGKSGNEYWRTWFPHEAAENNNGLAKASAIINCVMNDLMAVGILNSRRDMRKFMREHPGLLLFDDVMGYTVRENDILFCIRCQPYLGSYDFYVYCYLA